MTQENNSLDDFLQRKVEDAEFAFKEDYWEKMQQVLDDDEKDKKKPFWWRGIYVLVAALIVGAGALLYSNNNKTENTNANKQYVQTEATTTVITEKNDDVNAIKKSTENSTENEIDNLTQKENTETIKPQTENKPQADVQKKNAKRNDKKVKSNAGISTENIVENAKNDDVNDDVNLIKETSENNAKSKAKRKAGFLINKNDNKVEPAKMGDELVVKNKKNKHRQKNNIDNLMSKKEENNKTKKQQDKVPVVSDYSIIHGKKMKAIDSSVVTTKKRNGQAYNPRYVAGLGDYVAEKNDSVSVVVFSPVKENTNENKPLNASQNDSSKTKKQQSISLFAMLGINANKGFKSDMSNPTAWAVSPMLSFGIDKIISPKLTLSSQIGFTYFNGLNVNYKIPNYRYSFGKDSTVYSVDYKKMLQLYLPVSIQYQLAKKHFVLGGVGASYSFALASMVKEKQQSTATQSYNYRGGFKPLDLFLQAGYLFKMNDAFSFLAFWQQGLIDATDNTYFKNSISTKQAKMTIGIKYNFKRNGKNGN